MSSGFLSDKLGYALDFAKDHVIFDPKKRHDFLFLFDASNCNPNGDPDNDNMPRQDFESRTGLVSGPCLKRKIRDYMARLYGTEHSNASERMNLYVKHRGLLKNEHKTVANMLKEKGLEKPTITQAQEAMRAFFWDIRMFGAVLSVGKEAASDESNGADSTEAVSAEGSRESDPSAKATKSQKVDILNGGQCVGCVSIGMAESVDEISPGLMPIVRDARVENPAGSDDDTQAISAMPGNLAWMPYGLYQGTGHFSPKLDKHNLVRAEDLAVLWNALRAMFEGDPSSARPASHLKSLGAWVFSHDHPLGNYPVHKLFELIKPKKRCDGPARRYQDYGLVLGWTKNDGNWTLDAKSMKLHRKGKDTGVALTELYNDWDE